MKVCIVRNAEANSNAGVFRMVDALMDMNAEPLTLTRSRFSNSKSGVFRFKPFKYKDYSIPNYELQLKTDLGKGKKNIFQLVAYQVLTLLWLLKNRKKYDVIHAFDLDAGMPALICSILARKKIIYHIADFYIDSRQGIPRKLKKYVRKLENFVISKADATIICTEERKEQISGSKPKKLYIVHNSPVEEFQPKHSYNEHKNNQPGLLTIGYVGGLTETRFIREVIDFVKRNTHITLKIAGFGPLEKMVQKEAGKYSNILYYGRVSYEDALKLYSQCNVMFAMYDPAVPNHKYSAPNKVYEAMMLGKPIIVANGTGINTLVEDEKIGFSINYSVKEFSDTIDYLIRQEELLKQFNRNSRNAFNKYSWIEMKEKVKDIYIKL